MNNERPCSSTSTTQELGECESDEVHSIRVLFYCTEKQVLFWFLPRIEIRLTDSL